MRISGTIRSKLNYNVSSVITICSFQGDFKINKRYVDYTWMIFHPDIPFRGYSFPLKSLPSIQRGRDISVICTKLKVMLRFNHLL